MKKRIIILFITLLLAPFTGASDHVEHAMYHAHEQKVMDKSDSVHMEHGADEDCEEKHASMTAEELKMHNHDCDHAGEEGHHDHDHSGQVHAVKSSIERLKGGNNPGLVAVIALIIFSYGLLHGTGVAHGNAILAGWIMASRRRYRDVALSAILTGFFHALTATIVVLTAWFLLKSAIDHDKLSQYMRIISGSMVLLIGIYLLVTFIIAKAKGEHECCHGHSHGHKRKNNDVGPVVLALGAGIVPCPITSSILIVSLGFGLVLEGVIFIASFALGMSISLLAIASGVWYVTERAGDPKFLKYTERIDMILHILGPVLVIIIGIYLIKPYVF